MATPTPEQHVHMWKAIETIAATHYLTMSGLARLAGLDPTAFNISKRHSPEGRERWPSTESIQKMLDVTETSWSEFARIIDERDFKRAVTHGGKPRAVRIRERA